MLNPRVCPCPNLVPANDPMMGFAELEFNKVEYLRKKLIVMYIVLVESYTVIYLLGWFEKSGNKN